MASSNNSIAARIAALKESQEASQERPSSSGSKATARKSSTNSISARIAAMQGVPVMGMPMPGGPSLNKRGSGASNSTQQSEISSSSDNVSRMMSLDMQNRLNLEIGQGRLPSRRNTAVDEDALSYPLLSRPIVRHPNRKSRVFPELKNVVFSTEKQVL
uniref:Uncharacterized protein n=1 Tax=Leptocylindrus danicus TaxID=163516 RepID=A0A7S2JZP2_9STRA|mmetsp:Transcript_14988/g.22128  ORF Transcript_14988/g.22128 Transcript_14988/m.22128 type:complete len:159 (+) Transcript_14988:44-520(+)